MSESEEITKILKEKLGQISQIRNDIEQIKQTEKLNSRNDFLVRAIDDELGPIRRKLYSMVNLGIKIETKCKKCGK